jgi:DNA-binding transcriptional regulator/RsmH inhibitor MraZ
MIAGSFHSFLRNSGTLTLPAEWRSVFGERLVVTASLEDIGLLFWPVPSLERFAGSPEARGHWRFVLAAAAELSVKANGTFRLPERYRGLASGADTLFSRGDHALWTDGQRFTRRESARLRETLTRRGL